MIPWHMNQVKNLSLFFWRLLECLPLKRVHSLPDGSQTLSRRPVVGGMKRYIPKNAKVHGSVIRRLRTGSYNTRFKHTDYGIGEWVCVADGGGWGESWTRKNI